MRICSLKVNFPIYHLVKKCWIGLTCIWLPLPLNPLIPTVAKSSLTILMQSCKQKTSWRNISKRNVIQNITNNSPSNVLQDHAHFQSYCQKYCTSRCHFGIELRNDKGMLYVSAMLYRTISLSHTNHHRRHDRRNRQNRHRRHNHRHGN